VSAAGFDGIEISNNTPHVLPSRRRLYWMTQALWPGASLLWHIGMRSETQHGNTRGAREIYRAARRGLWRERILTATAR